MTKEDSTEISSEDSNKNSAADRYLIFEKAALDKLRSQTDQTKPVGFIPLRVKYAALAAMLITAFGVIWSIFARIPIQVNGQAVIIPEGVVSSIFAKSNGIIYYQISGNLPNQLSHQLKKNYDLSIFWRNSVVNSTNLLSINELMQLSAKALANPVGQIFGVTEFDETEYRGKNFKSESKSVYIPSEEIIAIITNPPANEELDLAKRTIMDELNLDNKTVIDRDKRELLYKEIDPLIGKQIVDRKKELSERQELLNRLKFLWSKGYISTAQLLSENATVNNLRQQIVQISRDQIGNSFSKNDQKEQSMKAKINSSITTNKFQNSLIAFMSKTFLISPSSGIYVVAKYMRNGMQVNSGDEILTYTLIPPKLPKTIPVFVDASTVQQLSRGMKVLVTPKGIARSEYGGITGTIDEVGRLPISSDGLASLAGGRSLANSISKFIPNPYIAKVNLDRSSNANCAYQISRLCYKWSTNRLPPFPVRIGSQADVQITTINRHPIEFVMPAIRRAFGFVTDS